MIPGTETPLPIDISYRGPRFGYDLEAKSHSVFLEQIFFKRIFTELAWYRQETDRQWDRSNAGQDLFVEAVVDNPTTTEDDVRVAIQAAGARAGITIDTGDITITGFRSGRGNPATVRIEYEHELRWVGVLLSLFTGERTLTLVSEFAMRNE